MKEVTAVIRMNMVSKTKEALLKQGFPCFTCRKVLGRGKKKVSFTIFDEERAMKEITNKSMAEEIAEAHRLVSKRMFTIIVNDEDVQEVINAIIEVNRTGNPGDGKIFVRDILDAIRIRTGETGAKAL
ncbi:P-II family nitrogen regulator [Clostridium sp. DJ247]|uniref:P-II family nitrogen regulator n=1 Tax=Clostridium sp. DJ247 TaxID=2726188 RepID=UPI001627E446|nr:P-II family nitrogen regulator [Clostridium sp. DJ247]MBC2582688.1 P-II family nitrogen regulator [Clostridium sp. DJ247]